MKSFKLFPILALLIAAVSFSACDQKSNADEPIVVVETDLGTIKFKLYDSTPKHKENFLKLAKEGFYDGTLFHRVIPGFMIQGGDPDSKMQPPANASVQVDRVTRSMLKSEHFITGAPLPPPGLVGRQIPKRNLPAASFTSFRLVRSRKPSSSR